MHELGLGNQDHSSTGGADKNPWNVAQPAFSYAIVVVDGITPGTRTADGILPPPELGQCVYAVQFPTKDHPGYLAGSAQIKNSINGSTFYFKKVAID